jgi:hypothetical protein
MVKSLRNFCLRELRAELYCTENCRHGTSNVVPRQDGLFGSLVVLTWGYNVNSYCHDYGPSLSLDR